jgi:hypothetical protein
MCKRYKPANITAGLLLQNRIKERFTGRAKSQIHFTAKASSSYAEADRKDEQ